MSAPFPNGASFDYWRPNNCEKGHGCIHDSLLGYPDQPETFCPLIGQAYAGEWPAEWPKVREIYVGDCTNYEEAVITERKAEG